MSLRAVLTREAKTIRLGRDALNALYKLVFIIIVMEMLKLSQMLKLLARNMTFSFQRYKKIRKEGLRNRELKAFRKLGI